MKNENDNSLGSRAVKAGVWYTVGNLFLKGCIFMSLPIFTRLLSTGDFGIYNTYIAYEQLLCAVLGLGLYGTVKNAKIDYKEDFEKYLSSVLFLSIIFLGAVLLAANLLYPIYKDFMGFSLFVVNCLILQGFGAYLLNMYGVKLNVEFKYKNFLAISAFNTIGNTLLSIFLVLFVFPNERYLGRILGSAIPMIAIGLAISGSLLFKGRVLYSRSYWKYALMIGLPLVPHVVSQSVLSQFDRIMITNLSGNEQSGIYSYIYTMSSILWILGNSMENAWAPWVFLMLSEDRKKEIKKAAGDYLKLFSVITIGFMCVMPEITKLMADKEYWAGIDMLVPLTIANYFILLYTLPVNIQVYNKKTIYISVGTVLTALLNALLNYPAIILWGYKAAAYTTLASYVVLFIFHWIVAGRYSERSVYSLRMLMKNTAVVAAVGAVILATQGLWAVNLAIRVIVAVVLLIGLVRERHIIIKKIRGA